LKTTNWVRESVFASLLRLQEIASPWRKQWKYSTNSELKNIKNFLTKFPHNSFDYAYNENKRGKGSCFSYQLFRCPSAVLLRAARATTWLKKSLKINLMSITQRNNTAHFGSSSYSLINKVINQYCICVRHSVSTILTQLCQIN
jgi:hypothetical protein